jgi:hypothetical protein
MRLPGIVFLFDLGSRFAGVGKSQTVSGAAKLIQISSWVERLVCLPWIKLPQIVRHKVQQSPNVSFHPHAIAQSVTLSSEGSE